jgi:hypothetical protein
MFSIGREGLASLFLIGLFLCHLFYSFMVSPSMLIQEGKKHLNQTTSQSLKTDQIKQDKKNERSIKSKTIKIFLIRNKIPHGWIQIPNGTKRRYLKKYIDLPERWVHKNTKSNKRLRSGDLIRVNNDQLHNLYPKSK